MSICPDWVGYGTLGDCVVLYINGAGLVVLLFSLFYGYITVYRKHYRQASSLLTQSLLGSGSSEHMFTVAIRYPGGITLLRAIQLISFFELVLCAILAIQPSDQSVSAESKVASDFTAYYVNIGIQGVGWIICLLTNMYGIRYIGLVGLYACISFGIFTVFCFGLVCVTTAVEDLSQSDSIGELAFFVVDLAATLIWSYIIFLSDTNSRSSKSTDRDNSQSQFKSFLFNQRTENVHLSNVVGGVHEGSSTNQAASNGKQSSFWGFGNRNKDLDNVRLSFDEERSETTASDDQYRNSNLYSNYNYDQRSDSVNSSSHNTHTSSKSIEYLRQMDLDGMTIQRTSKAQQPANASNSQSAANAGIARNATQLRNHLSLATKTNANNSEFTLSVVEYSTVVINGKAIVVYKFGLKEANAVKIALKRYDEIIYLREKLLNDFPHLSIAPVPALPVIPLDSADYAVRQAAEYEKHKQDMGQFLESLVTNPIAGVLVIRDLRASVQTGTQLAASATVATAVTAAESDVASTNNLNIPTLFPVLLLCEDRLEAKVNNWIALSSETNKKELKTLYEIEVKLRKVSTSTKLSTAATKAVEQSIYDSVHEECYPEIVTWTIRKRYRQFTALFECLRRIEAGGTAGSFAKQFGISFPTKGSKRRPKASNREYDSKLNENVLALDVFLQACLRVRPLPSCLLAFLESDVTSRQCGLDLLLIPSDESQTATSNRVLLMKTNIASSVERSEKASSIQALLNTTYASLAASSASSSGASSSAMADVKPLNQLLKPSTKKMMFFGATSSSMFSSKSSSKRVSAMDEAAENGEEDIDVRLSQLEDGDNESSSLHNLDDILAADDNEVPEKVMILVGDEDEMAESEDDGENGTDPSRDSQLLRRELTVGSDSSDEDDRSSMGGVRSQHSMVSKMAIKKQSSGVGRDSNATKANTNANASSLPKKANSPKKGSMKSMFQFMSSSSAHAGAGNSLKALSVDQLASWPASHLYDLIQILKFINSDCIVSAQAFGSTSNTNSASMNSQQSSQLTAQGSKLAQSSFNHFTPGSTKSDDYLSAYEAIMFNSSAKCSQKPNAASSTTAAASTSSSSSAASSGLWLSQYRLRKALLSTTAFIEWSEQLHLLQTIDLKTARNMSNDQKLCFCLNLYNLMSSYAAIMLPWPQLMDTVGRIGWQRAVKFAIGGSSSSCVCSLLQLEHCILRNNLTNMDLPSFFMTEIPYPSVTDIKSLSAIAPLGITEPRIAFALCLPYRNGNYLRIYQPHSLQADLRQATCAFLSSRISAHRGVLVLPKVLRIYYKDYEKWKPSKRRSLLSEEAAEDHTAAISTSTSHSDVINSPQRSRGANTKPVNSPDPISRSHRLNNNSSSSAVDPDTLSTAWDIAGYDRKYAYPSDQPLKSVVLGKRAGAIGEELLNNSDIVVGEYELVRLVTLLKVGVDVRDRKYRMKVYKSCFLGSDAVRCLLASGDAKTVPQSVAVCDLLILYGFIEHVSRDYWMKDQELFYAFTDADGLTESFNSSVASNQSKSSIVLQLLPFIEDHLDVETRKQVRKSLQVNDPIHYSCEDYCFAIRSDID